MVGTLFGGLLWAAVGALFARIVVYSAKAAVVYAGFAVVLLFLLWLYVSWLILLLGAQLSFYVQHPEHLRTGHADIPMTGALRERLAMSVMYLLGERFVARRRALDDQRPGRPARRPGDGARRASSRRSRRTAWCSTAEDDSLVPARDLGAITLAAILDAIRHEVPDPRRPEPRPVAAADAAAQLADEALRASTRRPDAARPGASGRTAYGGLTRRRWSFRSTRIEPVRMPPRTSTSEPTSTIAR